MPPLFVIADIHGHREELVSALRAAGLVDGAGRWAGGDARLWLLGDYVDRGPDGLGVIDDIRALESAAAAAGGEVRALLGNHEAQLLAAHRFGAAPVPGWDDPDGFRGGWARFGGREADLRRLTPDHISWIARLPAVALVDGHLLVHSDTLGYLEFGSTIAQINAAVGTALRSTDVASWLTFCGRLSGRNAFRDADPTPAVSRLLSTLGGDVIVHGHSTLTKHFGVQEVKEGLWYADKRVLAIDGGVYEGGRLLLTRLISPVRGSGMALGGEFRAAGAAYCRSHGHRCLVLVRST
ncbi:Calcineurin-like phosphoesterase [Asanoa hainanensis]|uniref:Calcineurin-like phosphoesterase n=1 Tax=Asanoa hainanensis TaxID=560556 RepID=A0A239N4G0_9ACTN|nr:metallophosphoesterase [Asanoa hainanensis]SNT49630.1 Calcineurin-like phosphoesterase [Asanoa hainanensis]